MATAIAPRGGDEIKLEYGVPQVVAFRFTTGKNVNGNYGPRVLFTSVDERKLWLDAEDGSDLERGMRDLGVGPSDFVRITKTRGVHGGGHSLRVERAEDAGASDVERQLRESLAAIERAKREKAATPSFDKTTSATAPVNSTILKEERNGLPAVPQSNGPTITPASAKLCACLKAAIDAQLEAMAYAARLGWDLQFSEESVRAMAITTYIGGQR